MKFLVPLLLLVANCAYAQNFEGRIVYNNTYKSKIKNLTNEQLQSFMGSRQEYFVQGAKYKSLMNGKGIQMQVYADKTNRIYIKLAKSDTLYWIDASVNTDPVTSYEIVKSNQTVLGKKCDVLIARTATGTTKLYFSHDYALDSATVARHQYNNWAFFISKCGSVPLKYVMETPEFIAESVAVEVKPQKLKEEFFGINESAPKKQGF